MPYSPFRHIDSIFLKRKPVHLTLFLTRRCNARCPFCFYLSRDHISSGRELSLPEIEQISSSLGTLLWLAFSGGEIFLRDELVAITELFYRRNKPAIILLPTNGLLPEKIYHDTEAILKRCPDSVVTVKLSLDGPEEIHDALRGVAGAYKKVLSCYESLAPLLSQYAHFELGINTVFCATNQDRIEETIRLVQNLKQIRVHTISLIRGEVAESSLKTVDPDKYKNAVELLATNMKNSQDGGYRFRGGRLKAAQDIIQRRLIHKTATENKAQLPCLAGKLSLVVTETGDVYPCESFADKLGNVRDDGYDLMRILEDRRSTDTLAAIRQRGCCCTHECNMMMNILFNPGQYPALLKEYLRL
ncbi:MAG: radical SAM protein [Proteobacteria bacterium]|nr:radical SAM protein [Pseudomonadota bacterium]MBU1736937.1 radical SAM protein [Pseudomonadota bacterium]